MNWIEALVVWVVLSFATAYAVAQRLRKSRGEDADEDV